MEPTVGPLEFAAKIAFYLVSGWTLVCGWFTVSARNLFRAALGLAGALFGVAVLYLYLQAEFLFVTQLLIYVGAILTLILFGVMLTSRIADPKVPRWNRQAGASLFLTWIIGGALSWAYLTTPLKAQSLQVSPIPLEAIGRALISTYLLPFELLSLLLVGALVGAIVIARRE